MLSPLTGLFSSSPAIVPPKQPVDALKPEHFSADPSALRKPATSLRPFHIPSLGSEPSILALEVAQPPSGRFLFGARSRRGTLRGAASAAYPRKNRLPRVTLAVVALVVLPSPSCCRAPALCLRTWSEAVDTRGSSPATQPALSSSKKLQSRHGPVRCTKHQEHHRCHHLRQC